MVQDVLAYAKLLGGRLFNLLCYKDRVNILGIACDCYKVPVPDVAMA